MASINKLYVLTMYMFGDREKHSYVKGVFTKMPKALEICHMEEQDRGGKYTGEVLEYAPDEQGLGKKIKGLE
jgi:hypothetical protein